jgi:ribosomal protein S18 acetylase RimI-like enzyme
MELNVYDFNRPAMAFYETLGYEILSHRLIKPLDAGDQDRGHR